MESDLRSFHDGAVRTPQVGEAVDHGDGRSSWGAKFSDKENADIVAFPKTLTGDQPGVLLQACPSCRRREAQDQAKVLPVLVNVQAIHGSSESRPA